MQVLLVVVLFILLFSMVPLFDLSASFSIMLLFQSSFMPSSTISSSEVPSMGGVHCDTPEEKQPALQRHHLSVSQPALGPLFGGSVHVSA